MDKEIINKGINMLNIKLTKANILVRELNDAICALQLVCEHDFQYEGHGHNDSYYTCTICGEVKIY